MYNNGIFLKLLKKIITNISKIVSLIKVDKLQGDK